MQTTQLAAQLQPYILGWIQSNRGWSGSLVNYLIYLEGGICYARDVLTGAVAYSGSDHAAVIQQAADAAGEGGVLGFRAGTYTLNRAIVLGTSHYRQTWWMQSGTRLRPSGNNSILNINNLQYFSVHGTLYIEDPSALTTSVPAIAIENLIYAYFERIFVSNYYRGINMTGTTGGTNENTFNDIYLQVRDRGLNLETSCHDNHFLHVWIKGPSPTNWATGPGLRIATGGTQGGNVFANLEILDMNWGMDLVGAYEVWFGNVIVDNAYALGIYISGAAEGLFFATIWSSSNGAGLVIGGDPSALPTTYADKIHIGKVYCWLNADYGIRFTGYTQQILIGEATVERNGQGIAFEGIYNRDIVINTLYSYDNTNYDVDGGGCERNVIIENALIAGTLYDLECFAKFGGARMGTGLYEEHGIATILNGQTSVVVTHGLEGTPSVVTLSPYHAEVAGAYVSARTSTTFTISVSSAVTANREIGWRALSLRRLSTELVQNACVDYGTGSPDNWTATGAGATWDATTYRSASRSLRLNVSGATAWWQASYFAVSGNQSYRLRAWVKGTGSTQTFLTIRWWSNPDGTGFISEDNIMFNSTYTNWTRVAQDFTAPASAQSADIMFRCPAATTADIYGDDFSVRRVI